MNADRGWEIHPQTIYEIAKRIQEDYGNIPWFISENGMGVENALQHAEDELALLAQFLRETGLAGMPLSKEQDVQQVTQDLFEQRARLSDATAMVSSMLEKKQAAT